MVDQFKISIELFLLFSFSFQFLITNAKSCLEIERNSLLSFKHGLEDPSGMLSSWIVGVDCCQWESIECDKKTNRVIALKLQNTFANGISGNINSSSLVNLKELRHLDLSMNNDLVLGNDFKWISSLSKLKHLNLGSVNLSFAANNWLESLNKLPSLVELHLPSCGLTNLPSSLQFINLTSLSVLELYNNGFKKSTIPMWLFNLTSLTYLDLGSNELEGSIPDGIASLNYIQHIDLSNNGLITGKLPKNLGKLCSLRTLQISETWIEGEIGEFIDGFSSCGNTSRLESLDLSSNHLGGFLPNYPFQHLRNLKYLDLKLNSFVGDIPESIGNLSSLIQFSVSDNQLNGSIPKSLGKLSSLSVLDLAKNPWNGIITEQSLFNLSSLKELSISTTNSQKINFVIDINPNWVPPFKLEYLDIKSCQVGPRFPKWLRNQNKLNYLVFKNSMISDSIPDWFLNLNLTLSWLELANNNLTREVPNRFVFEGQGFLDLSSNRFEGPLPLFSSNVRTLYLSDNLFSGILPVNIGQLYPKMENFGVSNNLLHGNIPISFGDIQSLTSITVLNNNLSGEIPLIWEDKLKLIWTVDLANNSLTGKIPTSMGSLSSLMFLSLNYNNLEGEIPSSLQNCTNILSLDLGNNMLSGEVPSWIGEKLSNLFILKLRSNRFVGDIPNQLCSLSDLHILDLAQNNLSGNIPFCVGNLIGMAIGIDDARYEGELLVMTKGRELLYQSTLYLVNSIDLSGNNLLGEIPKAVTNLSRLGTLNLSSNRLTGWVPDEIGRLSRLETLDLSKNQLFGPIPQSLASLTALNHLNLSYNDLSGRIPTGNQLNSLDDISIYANNPRLCGHPLTIKCADDVDENISDSHDVNDDKDEDDEDKNWFGALGFFISMSFGFAVGFWGFFGTLMMKESWRRTYFGFVDDKVEVVIGRVMLVIKKLKY
ncbi:receptor-like protein EIX1 [Impatiens glandulifera]|uniref:receptor-like protein EIX1 n=1 Tax=Impatiens glandulifera TaxID=253017 RepID=UPI001FB0FDED|nr:receptor-like protein EIX1 [Impatiens glandulifera]